MSEQNQSKKKAWRGRRYLMFGAIPAIAAAGLLFVPRAFAFGPFRHGPHGHHGHSPEEMREHMQKHVDFMLDRIDATDEQRDKVHAVLDKAAPEMFALRKEGRRIREDVKEALAAPQVDKARLAKAHQDLDALANRATDLGMNTMLSVAELLTPEQRNEIKEHLARMHPEP